MRHIARAPSSIRAWPAALLALLLGLPAAPARAQPVRVETGTITYHVTHKFKEFDSVIAASAADLRVTFDPADPGALTFVASIPLGAFDSANQLRDEHAAEALELFAFPKAVWRVERVEVVATGPTVELRATGPLTLHGVTGELTAPVTVTVGDDAIRFQSAFDLSLEAYGIERPGLLGFRIEDTIHVAVDLSVPR